MSKVMVDVSEEDADDFNSSEDDWAVKAAEEKKRATRRTSQRLRKKPRVSVDMSNSSSDEEPEETEPRKKKKHGISRPRKQSHGAAGMTTINKSFTTGGFLVLKKDVQKGDTTQPCLWRIDGKALLQKFEIFEDEGKTLHRSTSVYTGWSPLDKDLYAPVTVQVQVQKHASQQMMVKLNWEELKNAAMDSE